jgi:hypothetical protein
MQCLNQLRHQQRATFDNKSVIISIWLHCWSLVCEIAMLDVKRGSSPVLLIELGASGCILENHWGSCQYAAVDFLAARRLIIRFRNEWNRWSGFKMGL